MGKFPINWINDIWSQSPWHYFLVFLVKCLLDFSIHIVHIGKSGLDLNHNLNSIHIKFSQVSFVFLYMIELIEITLCHTVVLCMFSPQDFGIGLNWNPDPRIYYILTKQRFQSLWSHKIPGWKCWLVLSRRKKTGWKHWANNPVPDWNFWSQGIGVCNIYI